jgi:hypothetical protein
VVAVKVIRVSARAPPPSLPPRPPSGGARARAARRGAASAREGEGAAERAAAAPAEAVGAELARHEYESWLNANLRHPQIVQLFTSFTLALEAPAGATHAAAGSACGAGGGGAREGAAGATQWKTHLIMEWCDMGTMQVGGRPCGGAFGPTSCACVHSPAHALPAGQLQRR